MTQNIFRLTKSEIHAIMVGGFATIAGPVLAAFVNFGISPAHLISASIMSAPAGLAVAKLLYPETEESQTTAEKIEVMNYNRNCHFWQQRPKTIYLSQYNKQ